MSRVFPFAYAITSILYPLCLGEEAGESKRFEVVSSSERQPIVFVVTAVDKKANVISVKPAEPPAEDARSLKKGIYLGFASRPNAKKPEVAFSIEANEKFASEAGFSVDSEAIKSIKAYHRLVVFPLTEEEAKDVATVKGPASIKDGPTPADIADGIKDSRESRSNLQMISLAIKTYSSMHDGFPPAVIYGPDGKPWHSWRVLIARHPEASQGRKIDYNFDEPWDGPSNKKLLESMPSWFAGPGANGENGMTPYQAFVGEGAAFTGSKEFKIEKGATMDDIPKIDQKEQYFRDGASDCVLIGHAHTEVPWTKPEDIAVEKGRVLLNKKGGVGFSFGSKNARRTPLLFADGHVDNLTLSEAKDQLPKFISIAGGETIKRDAPRTLADAPVTKQVRMTFIEVDGKWSVYQGG